MRHKRTTEGWIVFCRVYDAFAFSMQVRRQR
nr:MAG TPA: hypothetical protein [Caudoviricetes sp.]DAS77206.1 MAG TPA: hypothetical protein [Caudoviricetes sp.]